MRFWISRIDVNAILKNYLGWQMASAAEQVPRSALLYKYAYYTNSEVMAFSIAWNQLMDWLAILALLLHTISDHFVRYF